MNQARDYWQLLELFLAVSRRLDAITLRLAPPLPINESHVLTALGAAPTHGRTMTAHELSSLLQIEKSSLSRLLSQLSSRDLVTVEPDPRDRRSRRLSITAAGRETLSADNRVRNQQVSEFARVLSTRAQSELVLLLRQMADNLGAPAVADAGDEHPLKEQIRRLTRGLGFLAADIFFSGVPLEECQVLLTVSQAQDGAPLSLVVDSLPYERTHLSRLVTALERAARIERTQSNNDRRQFILHLTPSGRKRLDHVYRHAEMLFVRALQTFSDPQVSRLVTLLQQAVKVEVEGIVNTVGPGSGVALVRSERERQLARGFLMEQLVRRGLHFDAPESLVAARGKTFVFYRHNSIVALLEFQLAGSAWHAVSYVEVPDALTSVEAGTFIAESFGDLFRQTGAESVTLQMRTVIERLAALPPFGERTTMTAAHLERLRSTLRRLAPDA